jgi:methionyl-tRNA formyltransferase
MRVTVISTGRAVAMPAVRAVVARWPSTTIIRPTDDDEPWSVDRARHELRRPVAGGRRGYQQIRQRRQNRAIRTMLADGSSRPLTRHPLPARSLNDDEGRDLLTELATDVLVLVGCPIPREPLLAVPTMGTLNVHLGIAPAYRGESTIFHALRRGDHDNIGATIHQVDRGVDSGPLVAHLFPALDPADDETTLLAKAARMVGPTLVEYLQLVEETGTMPGRRQPDRGTLYRRRDRYVRHDAADWISRRVRGRRPPFRPARVVRFYEPASAPVAEPHGDEATHLSRRFERQEVPALDGGHRLVGQPDDLRQVASPQEEPGTPDDEQLGHGARRQ